MPEGEEEDQEIENLFEQIMKENFPKLAKEIDFHQFQEAQRVPKKLNPKKHTPRHIIITSPKVKDEDRLRNLQDNFICSNMPIIGAPEREEEQETENLFENIVKENFPNLEKEIDFHEVQEAQRVPKKLDPRKHIPRHIIITLPKMKDKERT